MSEEVFVGFAFELCPKTYQALGHDKTMRLLLKVALERVESEGLLADLLNEFPVFGFVLDAYSRAVCSAYLKNAKNTQLDDS